MWRCGESDLKQRPEGAERSRGVRCQTIEVGQPRRPRAKQAAGGGRFWSFWTTVPGILTGIAALLTAIIGLVGLWRGLGVGASAPFVPLSGPNAFSISIACRATTATINGNYPSKYEGATVFFVFNDVLEDPQVSRNLPDATTFETSFDVARYLDGTRHVTVRVDNNEGVDLAKAETDCR